MISSSYIPSLQIERKTISISDIKVYYDKNDITFKYKEIGRIFLKNINYWADRDPAGQINKIKQEAAIYGADAVIIINETRKESSFALFDGIAGGNSGDVFQYSGIAIVFED
ncbi:MAG: hypothetical protein Q8K60_06570 [Parachlamydiaceae bacterium]|nr:hypothetical protein [Parachlamydiaceae bacterium]